MLASRGVCVCPIDSNRWNNDAFTRDWGFLFKALALEKILFSNADYMCLCFGLDINIISNFFILLFVVAV